MQVLRNCLITIMLMQFFSVSGQDWANLGRYQPENEKLISANQHNRVVFLGNSITEGWMRIWPEFFTDNGYINRGISGQTTPQMLVRFRADVISLKPEVVIILAGVNDIAGNTGPSTLEMIMDNIISMTEIAKANGINVILCSVLPANTFPWSSVPNPGEKIAALNNMIKTYCNQKDIPYLDYYTSMVDDKLGLKSDYTNDGVHPVMAGYLVMAPLAQKAIDALLNR